MDDFYRFSSDIKKRTPYAPKIINYGEVICTCKTCGASDLSKNIDEIVLLIEGKGKLPDKMLCGHFPLNIISEKVLNAWKENNVTGYCYHNVRLVNEMNMDIDNELKYYNISITGKTDLDFEKMGVSIINKCHDCGQVRFNKQPYNFGIPILKDEIYNKSDLFVFNYFENISLCNKKIIEIIYKYKLTNFSIEKIEAIFDYMDSGIDIKSLFK